MFIFFEFNLIYILYNEMVNILLNFLCICISMVSFKIYFFRECEICEYEINVFFFIVFVCSIIYV